MCRRVAWFESADVFPLVLHARTRVHGVIKKSPNGNVGDFLFVQNLSICAIIHYNFIINLNRGLKCQIGEKAN